MSSSAQKIYELLFGADVTDGPLGLRERGKIKKIAAILKAARALFSSIDYEAAKMDDIAARAEVSKATLYCYFETKETLLVALFAQTQHKIDASRARFLKDADLTQPVLTNARYEALLNELGASEFPINLWRVLYASRLSSRTLKPGILLAGVASTIIEDRHQLLTRMIHANSLRRDMDVASVARILHAIGRLHWETFISDPAPDLRRTNEQNAIDIHNVLNNYVA